MNHPEIPSHWSPEQALAVYQYLQQLRQQLWFAYRADWVKLLGELPADGVQPITPTRPRQLELFDNNPDDTDLPF